MPASLLHCFYPVPMEQALLQHLLHWQGQTNQEQLLYLHPRGSWRQALLTSMIEVPYWPQVLPHPIPSLAYLDRAQEDCLRVKFLWGLLLELSLLM